MTVIIRGKINATNEWTNEQVLFRAKPELYTPSGAHYGSRFIFDRQGHLFYTLGERMNMANAQDLSSPLGKIHRINDDGTVPNDNPFVNTPNAVPSIWTTATGPQVWCIGQPAVGVRTRTERWRRSTSSKGKN